MGRDLTLYPRAAGKIELKNYLEELGFKRCLHFWDWPKGTLNYSWFDQTDFKSIDGVSADVYPVSGDEINPSGTAWALHVRNVYGASWHDVNMLNAVLRGARKRFGGTILGDYGTNRYAPLWKDTSTPVSRGVAATYEHVRNELSAVKLALPQPMAGPKQRERQKVYDFIEFTRSLDPSRVIYNGLVPFAVSMFEYFFSQIFQILISYDEVALARRRTHKQKVDFPTLLEVGDASRTIASVIAESYSFQNLDQLNKAFLDWMQIDVRKVLYKKRRVGNTVRFLEKKIAETIEYRHGIVHHFAIDRSLTRDGYVGILEAVEKSMVEFVRFLEARYKFKVEGL